MSFNVLFRCYAETVGESLVSGVIMEDLLNHGGMVCRCVLVVRMMAAENRIPDRSTLNRAAAIAAYHSKARSGGWVAVSGTLARHVTKPRGAKPGTVQIRKERVFKVQPALP